MRADAHILLRHWQRHPGTADDLTIVGANASDLAALRALVADTR